MQLSNTQYSFDIEVESHAPELYDYASIAEGVDGFESVDDQQITRYHQQGYLAINHAFNSREVKDAIDALSDLVVGKYPDFGNIQFSERVRERLYLMTLDEKLDAIRKLHSFTEVEPRLKAMAEHPSLLQLVARLIDASPELYQSMALLKPPQGREKPWHQDHSHFDLPLKTRVVGVWIALDPATTETGCMRVLPGWHRRGPMLHRQLRDFQIRDEVIMGLKDECSAVPLEPGGCLLFDSYLPHGTPANQTNNRRRAVQFHFLPVNTPRISDEERLAVFCQEG